MMAIGLVYLVPELNMVPQPFVHSLDVLCCGQLSHSRSPWAKPQKMLAVESTMKTKELEMILAKVWGFWRKRGEAQGIFRNETETQAKQ